MFEFRRATVADSAVIAAMEKEYIECAWSENTVREALSDADTAVYLLIVNGETAGYGGLKTVFETAEIYNIAVMAQNRRKGFGKTILAKLCEHAAYSGAREILLEVNEHNEAALALYKSFGFKLLNTRKNYYKSGSALVFRKEI